jgi:ADP-ribose pyrophosphatase YjhB (NUDIX family)
MAHQAQDSFVSPPRPVVCVGAVVLRGNRALFVRQAKGHALAGQWSIPWGLWDAAEPPEAAALRETQEEGGITAEIKGLLGVQNLRRERWVALLFLCRHVEGEPVPDGFETDSAAYFSLAQMDAFEEPFEQWCEWLVRRVLSGQYHLVPVVADNPYHPRLAFL